MHLSACAGLADRTHRALTCHGAAAALLRDRAPGATSLDDFVAALAPDLRAAVTTVLARGVDGRDAVGATILVGATRMPPTESTVTQALGYGGAAWVAASSANY